MLGFIYSISLIDRTNLGVARIAGMQQDLVRKPIHLRFQALPNLPAAPGHWRAIQHRLDGLLPSIHYPVRLFPLLLFSPKPELHAESPESHREVPGNVILRWLGARSWITICVVGWGAAQTGMAFVPTWGVLCLTRVLLGAFEVSAHARIHRKTRVAVVLTTLRLACRRASSQPWCSLSLRGTNAPKFRNAWRSSTCRPSR